MSGGKVRRPWWRRALWPLLVVAVLLGVVVAIGLATPPGRDLVQTDALGPEHGESAEQYRARAAASLEQVGGEERWGMVSYTEAVAPDAAAQALVGVRISQVVVLLTQGDDTWTDWIDVAATPANREAARTALDEALRTSAGRMGESSRERDVAARSALVSGCACVQALVVRADGPTLRALALAPAVQAVEALPADAVYGRFAVRPG